MTNPYQALEEDFGYRTKIHLFNNYQERKLADEEEEEKAVEKRLEEES